MTRANMHSLARPNRKVWGWVAAGFLIVGIAGMNHDEPRGMGGARTGGYAPMAGGQRSAGGGGFGAAGDGVAPQTAWNAPNTGGMVVGVGGGSPQGGGFVPAAPAAATASDPPTAWVPGSSEVPTSGDSVSDRVNTNFSDYMRDQQRVVSENDGQTYVVDSNAEPNQMVDTRDSVSGFSAATPGSAAAGVAEVASSGATTVDTSTSTPVETSSTPAGE
jgi:hypothetical protein